ncbi:MAG: pyrroline-5-carboxylate reductase [Puniceicoccales bacterium]|jgi:pyrroline-5-carboxylate reductase|nr:pyrroline-5-carboxylate reductase [Puniceicoccales bacterium]
MEKIAFLGAGKMASAIVRGLIESGAIAAPDIACLGGNGTSARQLAQDTGIRHATSTADLLDGADVLVLACKPQHFKQLDPGLGTTLTSGKLVLSVLAGFTAERLAAAFPNARAVAAVMPNTPAQVRAGITAWTAPATLPVSDADLVGKIFGCLGKVVRVEAPLMDVVSATSGSGPGFFFELVNAFEHAAVGSGLPPDTAALLVRETFAGAAKLLKKTNATPVALRNAVTSPNGSTLAGLQVFERHHMHRIFQEVIAASVARTRELGKM